MMINMGTTKTLSISSLTLLLFLIALNLIFAAPSAATVLTLLPTQGPVLTPIGVSGTGFLPSTTYSDCLSTSSSSTSACIGTIGSFTSDSSGNIPPGTVVPVPSGTASGTYYVLVYTGSTVSASAPFIVTAVVGLLPAQGPVGISATMSGAGFSISTSYNYCLSTSSSSTSLCIVGSGGSFTSDTSGNIPPGTTVSVPSGTPDGDYYVLVYTGSTVLALAPFTVTAPAIALSPTQGPAGKLVSVDGSGFSPGVAIASLQFNGATPSTYFCTSTISSAGTFFCSFDVPPNPPDPPGTYIVSVSGSDVSTGVPSDTASATFTITGTVSAATVAASACSIATLFNTSNGWISVCIIVVLFSLTLAGLIYAFSNILPTARGEQLKRITKYEIFEALLSLIIIFALFGMAVLSCNVGAQLTGQSSYTNLFTFADTYLGTLLFTNGVSIVSQLYSKSVEYVVASNMILILFNLGQTALQAFMSSVSTLFSLVQITPGSGIGYVLYSYSGTLTLLYAALMVIAFAPLFILFLVLPLIQGGALTVVVPVALVLRSLSFVGPKVREASNLFLAIAIGFYFILPLTLVFNVYVADCLNIGLVSTLQVGSCAGYPLAQYATGYTLPTMTTSLFTTVGEGLVGISSSSSCSAPSSSTTPTSTLCSFGGVSPESLFAAYAGIPSLQYIPGFAGIFADLVYAPAQAVSFGEEVSYYLFLGIVLLSLDLAITVGFINGLGKGLNSISSLFGVEPLFGD